MKKFNAHAAQVIQANTAKGEKYITLAGKAHVTETLGVKGMQHNLNPGRPLPNVMIDTFIDDNPMILIHKKLTYKDPHLKFEIRPQFHILESIKPNPVILE